MDALASLAGPILGFVDSLVYTDQEKARDANVKAATQAADDAAHASVGIAQAHADSTRAMALYGALAVGVVMVGLVAYRLVA